METPALYSRFGDNWLSIDSSTASKLHQQQNELPTGLDEPGGNREWEWDVAAAVRGHPTVQSNSTKYISNTSSCISQIYWQIRWGVAGKNCRFDRKTNRSNIFTMRNSTIVTNQCQISSFSIIFSFFIYFFFYSCRNSFTLSRTCDEMFYNIKTRIPRTTCSTDLNRSGHGLAGRKINGWSN